ncbi:MAG: calcium:sodium antiporter [Gammaproteobacteria bacterium]|nr:calcium:sodium antiporter [Gammaproteobacteria bacterium]|tara:strand:- start:7920 stop:8972 length:1053 start_codon:yes stop_codon:yes gene_type:complete
MSEIAAFVSSSGSILVPLTLLILGLIGLIYGADKLIDDTAEMAERLGTSEFIIGLTIIALGTSLPEVFVGIQSVMYGAENIAIGTVIGSNIANIGLIFGTACIGRGIYKRSVLVKKLPTQKANLVSKKQYIPLLLSVFVLGIFLRDYIIEPWEGFIIFAIIFIFLATIFKDKAIGVELPEEDNENDDRSKLGILMSLLFAIALLFIGSEATLMGATGLALNLGISEAIVGLLIVAIGTSLPELAATISAIIKNRLKIIVGNVIGSNVLNIVLVVPIVAIFGQGKDLIKLDPVLYNQDFFVMAAMTLLFASFLWLHSLRDNFRKPLKTMINSSAYSFIFLYFLYIIFRVTI